VAIPVGIPGLGCRLPGRVGLPGTLGMSIGLNGGEPARPPTPLTAVPRQNNQRLTHAPSVAHQIHRDGDMQKQHKIRKKKLHQQIVTSIGGYAMTKRHWRRHWRRHSTTKLHVTRRWRWRSRLLQKKRSHVSLQYNRIVFQ